MKRQIEGSWYDAVDTVRDKPRERERDHDIDF